MYELWGPERRRDAAGVPRVAAESLRLAWEVGRRELTTMLAMQVLTAVGIVATVLIVRSLLSGLLDADRTDSDVGELIPELVAFSALTVALGVIQVVQRHRQRILGELCQRHGEGKLFAVTGSVELAAFDEPGFHDMVERAVVAARLLPTVVNGVSGLLRALAAALGALVALLVLVPLFAPVVLLVLGPLWLATRDRVRIFSRFLRSSTPRDRERRYLGHLMADRDTAKEIRAYGLLGFLQLRHTGLWDERISELRPVADRELRIGALANVVASLMVSAALLALIALTLADHVSLAAAGTAAATIALLGQRLSAAAVAAGALSESAVFVEDYLTLVGEIPAQSGVPASAPAEPASVDAPRVRAVGVTFSYAGAPGPAVRDVSLEIAPGQVVAVVGENGSGKTTLAKLLAGLYLPERGRVTLNGVETASADRDALLGSVAVIFQDFARYALTARENIGMGRHERLFDDDAIRRAARIAGADDTLKRLPEEYDTMLGPAFAGGTDLSLGQWQRVALARALFRDAPFVILDEPTAALDARAEHEVFARIRKLLAGRSVLLISHRFPSVRMADRIHVMHEGAIVESGTHEELLAEGGRYAELFTLQAVPYR